MVQPPESTPGSIALYSCQEGYTLNGNDERTCLSDGEWSGADPTCESKFCKVLVNHGMYKLFGGKSPCDLILFYLPLLPVVDCGNPPLLPGSSVSLSSTSFGSVATYTCDPGLVLVGEDTTITCEADGEWSEPGFTCVGRSMDTFKYASLILKPYLVVMCK